MADYVTEQRKFVVEAKLIPLGFQQISSLAAAQHITPPKDARVALIQAVTQNVRWRDDGTVPTASIGMQAVAGEAPFLYTGDLAKIQFIEETASAEVNISYYF